MAAPGEITPTLPEPEAREALQRYVRTLETDRPATLTELLALGIEDTRLPLAVGDFVLHHGTPLKKSPTNFELLGRYNGWRLRATNADYSGSGFRFMAIRGTHRAFGIGPHCVQTLNLPEDFGSASTNEISARAARTHSLFWADPHTAERVVDFVTDGPPAHYSADETAHELLIQAVRERAEAAVTIAGFIRVSHHLISGLLATTSSHAA